MSKLSYQRESVERLIDEVKTLVIDHYHFNGDEEMPLDPDWDLYRRLAAAGKLFCWVARYEGRLIGYMAAAAMMSSESRKVASARVIYFYVEPRIQRAMVLRRLFVMAIDDLKKMRIQDIKIEFDAKQRDQTSRLLAPLGFIPSRLVFKMETAHA